MSDFPTLFVTVQPATAASATITAAAPAVPAATLDFSKATTLSYQMPDARSEISRLQEVKRSLEKDLAKYRGPARSEPTSLGQWLKRNEDLSLADVNLGDSEMSIKTIAEEEVSGFGRYALRGDLKHWMDRVAAIESNIPVIAGDWTNEDKKAIEIELQEQVRKVVAADALKRRRQNIELIQGICKQLTYISDGRDFRIDSDFVVDDTEQLKRLAESVDDWNSHIERHGHPHKQTEAEIARKMAEAEAKRRRAELGIAAAGKTVGMELTDAQLDLVLAAFYDQRQPSTFLSKKEKAKIEAAMVSEMKRASMIERAAMESVLRLKTRISEMEARETQLLLQLEAERSDPMRKRTTVDNLEHTNATIQTAAEVLARKRIREAEDVVASITLEFQSLLEAHRDSQVDAQQLAAQNGELKLRVAKIEDEWNHIQTLRIRHEEEMARVHGGRVSDLQRLVATLQEVFAITFNTFNCMVTGLFRWGQDPQGSAHSQVMGSLTEWCDCVTQLPGVSEGVKVAALELLRVSQAGAAEADALIKLPASAGPPQLRGEKEFIDQMVRKLDNCTSELQASFREKRGMRKVVHYFCELVAAMKEGSTEAYFAKLELPVEQRQSFPPAAVVGDDDSYMACWGDELRAFDHLLALLRSELLDSTDRSTATNALLHVVELYGESLQESKDALNTASASASKAPTSDKPTLLNVPNVVTVQRDSRMLLHDAADERKRLKAHSAVQVLRNIANSRKTVALPSDTATDSGTDRVTGSGVSTRRPTRV
jgi:hypothetical protein